MTEATLTDRLCISDARADGLGRIIERLLDARAVVLTTHVNADGDGIGSEAAIAAWLESRGVTAAIVNPTRFPHSFDFLLHRPDLVLDLGKGGEERLRQADLVLVLDTSEPNRIAPLLDFVDRRRTLVVDHHPAGHSVVGDTGVQDPTAAATGELVYDLITLSGSELSPASALGVYVALVSDTGSFRFSNSTPRAHLIAADLLSRGVDPEKVFQRLYATAPLRRIHLLREALSSLETEPELGLSWMVVPRAVTGPLEVTPEDFEGLIDHARQLEGTEVALLFRETPDGRTKISFRSNGEVDVNLIARKFGGGGHVKASGATIQAPLSEVVPAVLEESRATLIRYREEGR